MPDPASPPPVALTVAGSDSGGGAGIQADLRTFHQFGVFGTTAVTAVTVQDTTGVAAVHPVPPEVVRGQIEAVLRDLAPAAVKSGMLGGAGVARCLAAALRAHPVEAYVLDPVMVATSGDPLLDRDAVAVLREELLPLAAVVTPNLAEAAALVQEAVEDEDAQAEAARTLVAMGARAALVTGGHLSGDAVDVLWDGRRLHTWRRPRIETRHTHGTGCTLSAAVTAGLARGRPLVRSVEAAVDYVGRAIATAPGLGRGHGPVNHFAPVN